MNASVQSPSDVIARHQNACPVDVEAIARDLGIAVAYDVSLGGNVSGKIVKDERASRSGYAIYINAADNERRQRFTLAHEIAHFVLHRDLIGDGVVDSALYRSSLSDEHERQANRMAADMLLPAPLVRSRYRTEKALSRISAAFNVSEDAMRIRLKELRLGA